MAFNTSHVSRPGLAPPARPAFRSRRNRLWRDAFIAAGFLLVHLALDRLSLRFQTGPGITIWYPPNGLSFALLLGLGPGYAPVVLIATLISNFWTYGAPAPAVPLALWSVFIVACYTGLAILLRGRLRLDTRLRSVRDVSVFTAAAIGMSLSLATLVILLFSPGGPLTPAQYLQAIFDWWIGEAIGLFTITPFALVLVAPWLRLWSAADSSGPAEWRRLKWSRQGLFTLAVWLIGTALSLWLIFRTPYELQLGLHYLVFLPLMWLTLRDGLGGAVTATIVINLGGTLLSQAEHTGLPVLAGLQLFMLVLALTGLYLGAAVTQRGLAQAAYQTLVDESLQGLVVFRGTRVVFANRLAAQTLALDLDGLAGGAQANALDRIVPDDRGVVSDQLAALMEGYSTPARFEFRLQQPDGALRWLEAAGSRIEFGGSPAVQLVFLDITDRTLAAAQAVQRVNQLTAIYGLGNALAQTLDLDQIYGRLYEAVQALLPDSVELQIALFDRPRAELRCVFAMVNGQQIDPAALAPVQLEPPGLGTQSEAVHTRRAVIINDLGARLAQANPTVAIGVADRPRSGLYVPMLSKDEVIGVVQTQSTQVNRYTPGDGELLSLVANTAAVAVQNARHLADAERRLENVQSLHAIDLAIAGSFELDIVLDIVLKQVTSQLHMDAAAVHLLNLESGLLEHAASRGFRGPAIEQTRLRPDRPDLRRMTTDLWVMGTANLGQQADPFGRPDLIASESFAAHFCAPLIVKGQLRGVLEVFQREPSEQGPEWQNFLMALAAQTAIAVDNARLFENLQTSSMEIMQAYDATIEGWSRALDLRDKETEGHSRRVTERSEQLARSMGMSEAELLNLHRGALLHDIGKMGIPDPILLKPSLLTEDEWVIMRRHPTYAYEMLSPIAYLKPALDIPYAHHERWDGTGYPRGLKGEEIPLAARIFAIVDVWDALRSDRPYRTGWPAAKVREHIRDQAGTHFDPAVVQAFEALNFGDEL